MNEDKQFNTSGKFATDSNFWVGSRDEFVTENGITSGFSKVLGEQVFRPLGTLTTPFYNQFAGRPLMNGKSWSERAVYKNVSRRFKPKATAEDDLSFKDSSGLEKYYDLDISGWIKATIPTDLETVQMMMETGKVGELNSLLVENVLKTYQYDMNAMIGKKLVSNINHYEEVDFTDGVSAIKSINNLALRMRSTNYHYNGLTNAQNDQVITISDNVICFIDAMTLEDIRTAFASLPSPDRITENVKFVPLIDGCPTPVTNAEYTQTTVDEGGTAIAWTERPSNLGGNRPTAMLVSSKICEYRPLGESYRINLTKNGAGDFTNEHLLWKGGIAISPFENAINLVDSA